ncbi:MAG: bifunctional (p)ppGpp synthetase/guanosine-3',5'-bis(diphosphate) 3'-pyrophosphohydrolase [Nannocystaceae bacterium]|nr:bifunctional (p)ppGpp synthetase/guanosine-3',5'-bis(diphosphate) 3'-pyrophosphohydrolase [Nannocystaceae bacterium]
MSASLQAARAFAVTAHGEQQYGENRYLVHLESVVALLAQYSETHRVVGYLHDVVEDTDTAVETLEAEFGSTVARWVALVTDEPGDTRQERKAKTYAKLAEVTADGPDAGALVVKTADRMANVWVCVRGEHTSKLQTYRDEHAAFRAAAFRPGLCDALWSALDDQFES